MKITEEIANSVGAGGVAGMTEPVVRRGKFGKHETFILTRESYMKLKDAKKKGKHWRTYLDEDETYNHIREYARKHKGPIVVECESTGACMFVRYGDGALFEAHENELTKRDKSWLSDAGKDARDVRYDVRNDHGKDKYLGKFKGHYVRKTSYGQGDAAYHLQDPKTKKITHSVNGSEKNGVLKVGGASSTGASPVKMHDFYHHLIKNHLKAVVGSDHSEGAKKVWQRLAKKPGVSMHGWHKDKAVNLDPQNETETHGNIYSDDKEERDVAATKLVASYHKKGAKKL